MPWLGIAVAGGAGLLIGLERERRKKQPGHVAFAGMRTFTLAALAGALAQALGQPWMVLTGALLLGALITVAYVRSSTVDNGATTELALFVTYLIGVAAISQPMLAAGVSVAVTVLLASRTRLHVFANEMRSPDELRDALILAASALIVLPLAPSTPVHWLGGLDLRQVWTVVVLLLAIQAAGHVALRVLGPRHGLAGSGFFSGFITSTGTIAAYGLRLSLARSNETSAMQLQLMLLLALSTNTASKLVATLAGGRDYALRVMPGLLLAAGAAWVASLAAGRL